jgi:hypothetical protein
MTRTSPRAATLLSALVLAAVSSPGASAQSSGAWFGLPLPPGLDPHALQVIDVRPAAPAVVPEGEGAWRELSGSEIRPFLERIVEFSRESQETKELGTDRVWGRVSGFASGNGTIEWAAEQFVAAGLAHVELQRFEQDGGASIWNPTSWEVRLIGNSAYGQGTRDVVLESAFPLSSGEIPAGGLTAPLVYVGNASAAELAHIDVRGKVAVQKAIPQGHTVFLRSPVGPRAQNLLARGAVAVLTVIDLPGNMHSRDMGCGGGACLNIGGRDGLFLESVLDKVAEAGAPEPQVHIAVESQRASGLSSLNAVAVLPGVSRPDEYVILNAHADAWFDGAGDNGDGLAVLIALARHFARPEMRQERSIVFVASAGHHSSGLSGPGHFVQMNPDIVEGAVLIVNLEHTSERNILPARSEAPDGYREWTMDSGEAPIVAGVTNLAPYLEGLISRGIERYGTNFVSGPNRMASGEGGAYGRTGVPIFTTMQGSPLYHTTGEVLEMISTPGMERMARFMAYFVKEVSEAPAEMIDPPSPRPAAGG